jgi:hypothetical protein
LASDVVKSWLQSIWLQVFRKDRIIPPERYLEGNLTVGLFSVIVILAGAAHPEQTNILFYVLAAATAATHVGGFIVAKAAPRVLDTTIVVQAICLLAATLNLVVMNLWLTIHVDRLSNVRYLPGVVLLLSTYAGLQLELVGPPRFARLRMKRLGILLGIVSEAATGAVLLWRLVSR